MWVGKALDMNDMQVCIHFSLSNVALWRWNPMNSCVKQRFQSENGLYPFEIIQRKLGKAIGTLFCLIKKFLIQHIMGIILELCALAYPVSYLFTFKLTFKNNKLLLVLYVLNITLTAFTTCQGCRKTAKKEGDFCNFLREGEGRMGRGSEDEAGPRPTYSVWILWLVHGKIDYGEIHIRQKTIHGI